MTPEIIEQLKSNEKPFIWVDPELRKIMLGIGVYEFQFLFDDGTFSKITEPNRTAFYPGHIYRLRPDYQPERSIVECEIVTFKASPGFYSHGYMWEGMECAMDLIPNGYKREGFKFEDGKWYPLPIMPVRNGCPLVVGDCDLKYIESGTVEVLHAKSVLFRNNTK